MKLFIVESPAKCSIIRRYLPDGFHVMASVGHIRDLDKKTLSVDVDNDFKPIWKTMPGKSGVISKLKEVANRCTMVYLATDMDLEGESISWHLAQVLALPDKKIRRVTFNQITKNAIRNSLEEADNLNSQIDDDKVDENI